MRPGGGASPTARDRAERDARSCFALALGTFAIGSGEFGSNGIVQLFADDLGVSVPTATNAITAYALGVVIGSPVLTIVAARLNRRTLLLGLVGLFVVGNLLSALASDFGLLVVARFITGTVQGAYFGAGAVVASYAYGPGKGGKAFATVMAGLTIATIVGSPLGTFIGQQVGLAGPLRGRGGDGPARRSGDLVLRPAHLRARTGDPSRRSSVPCVVRWCG